MDVQFGCICPGTPHDQDTVSLPEELGFQTVMVLTQSVGTARALAARVGDGITVPEMMGVLLEAYLLYTISGWSLVDEAGKPLPVSKENVRARLMPKFVQAEKVATAADSLYTERYLLPLLFGASTSSPRTPTGGRTPRRTNGQTPRKPSKRSSISTIPTAVTGPMAALPAGVSS